MKIQFTKKTLKCLSDNKVLQPNLTKEIAGAERNSNRPVSVTNAPCANMVL